MKPVQVTIFHTNDIHAHLEPLARLSAFARRKRLEAEAAGRQVFFWDAGDAADRRVRFCSLTKGAAFAPLLNALGISLQTVGNAISLPYGPQALAAVAERTDFPLLAANLRDGDGPVIPGVRSSVLIPLPDGLMIGVFGLTAPWGGIYEAFGLHLPNTIPLARKLVAELQGHGAAPIILLSHLGLVDDRMVAENVPGIDLIIGAHSHDTLPEGEEHAGVLIAQAGDYARALGVIEIALDPSTGRIISRQARVLPVPEDEAEDPLILKALAAAEAEAAELERQPIGELTSALDLDYFAECGLGNLAADALRERMAADAAFVAGGQFHQPLEAGTLTLGPLDRACFSSANPAWTEITGAELREALERGLDPDINTLKHHGFRGTPYGIPQISGLVVRYNPLKPVGQRILSIKAGGAALEPNRTYRIAHTDAETIPDVGYFEPGPGHPAFTEVPTILREVLADYIRDHSPVPEPKKGRWIQES